MAEDVFGIVGSTQASVFRVDEVVAEGGFAVVYRAHHAEFRADVALKCLKVPGALTGERQAAFLQQFREEGQLLFHLSALLPPVVRPLQVGVLQSATFPIVPFIAMEWLQGESLDAWLGRRRAVGKPPPDLRRVVQLLGPVARALECAHAFPTESGRVAVLHRDLKPENLFLSSLRGQQTVKILDFGIAKVKSEQSEAGRSSSVEEGLGAFTQAYGAPEQWLPKRFGQTGPWTDVWGFALTLTEALSGRAPFEGEAQSVLAACIDETERPSPRALGAQVPDAVEAAFQRALAVDPRRRFQSLGEFWDCLEVAVGVHTPRFESEELLESMMPPTLHTAGSMPALGGGLGEASLPRGPSLSQAAPQSLAVGVPDLLRSVRPRVPEAPSQHIRLELDAQPLAPSFTPRSRLLPVGVGARASLSPQRATAALMSRLKYPGYCVAIGVLLMGADFAYARLTGNSFSLGPVRAFWLAAPLVIFGLLRVVLVLVSSDQAGS